MLITEFCAAVCNQPLRARMVDVCQCVKPDRSCHELISSGRWNVALGLSGCVLKPFTIRLCSFTCEEWAVYSTMMPLHLTEGGVFIRSAYRRSASLYTSKNSAPAEWSCKLARQSWVSSTYRLPLLTLAMALLCSQLLLMSQHFLPVDSNSFKPNTTNGYIYTHLILTRSILIWKFNDRASCFVESKVQTL